MPNQKSTPEAELNAATWIIEQLFLTAKRQIERSHIRRAVDQAAETFATSEPESWEHWFVEACRSLGQTCRLIDATPSEVMGLVRNGVVIVVRPSDGVWRCVAGYRWGSFRLLTATGQNRKQKISSRHLASALMPDRSQTRIRCVLMERRSMSISTEGPHEHERSPVSRIISLLRAERGDIWVVIAFALVSGLLGITTPLAVEALVNTVAFGRFFQPVIVLSLMLLAFLLFQAATKALQTFIVEIIQRRLFARVAADLAYRLPRTTLDAFGSSHPPELVNRFFDIVTVQKVVAELLLSGITVLLSAIVGMAVLAFYHPFLLAFDIVLILMMLFTVFVLGQGAVKTSIKESKTKYVMASWLEDLARCRTSFRHHGAPEFALERSNQLIFNYLSARKKHFRILMRQIIFLLLIQALASTALLGIGGWLVISKQLSLGQLVAAELIVAIVVGSFAKLGKHVESFYDLLASIDKLGHLFDLEMERMDGILTMPVSGVVEATALTCHGDHGEAYFHDLSFRITSGQHTALCGDSKGPLVLLEILFGLREPTSGAIAVYGINPKDIRPDILRSKFALARDIEVFAGTVAENVHMARSGVSVNHVRTALDIAGLLPAVLRLSNGMETELSQTGAPFTRAELAKLMIARAIAGQPDYLLIDGLLDSFSEADGTQLLDALLAAENQWTVILATHRSALRKRMTQFIVVNETHEGTSTLP